MKWYNQFSAIFFDLDGLLVNTEALHWKAYQDMCSKNGCRLDWDFTTYYSIASRSANGVRDRLFHEMPALFKEKTWEELYQEKRKALQDHIAHDAVPLMPGVEEVLLSLAEVNVPIAVVTHSPKPFVDHIRKQHDCFSVIQEWFTRECYSNPKPAPDGYLYACDFFGVEPSTVIGFEDSLRGIEALTGAGCKPVIVQMYDQSAVSYCREKGIFTLDRIDRVLSPHFSWDK